MSRKNFAIVSKGIILNKSIMEETENKTIQERL